MLPLSFLSPEGSDTGLGKGKLSFFCKYEVQKENRPMANKKGVGGIKIKLKSSESAHCYFTTKPKASKKLEIMKYDPNLRKHVLYKESKKL
jgi:large subunit ribosomal protein L33